MRMTATLNMKALERYPDAVEKRLAKVIVQTINQIKDDAQTNCPVKSGAAKASHYTVTDKTNDYSNAAAGATAALPGVRLFPDDVTVTGPLEAKMVVAAEHAIYPHDGTGAQAPQSWVLNAALDNLDNFSTNAQKAMKDAQNP